MKTVAQDPKPNGVGPPLFPDIGVVAFVPEKWGGPWLSRHQVLTRLSRYFHVVWAEPAKRWRELLPGSHNPVNPSNGSETFPEGFLLYQPGRWLPWFGRPAWLDSWTAAERGRRAAELLRQRGCKTIIFYLWRPYFDRVLESSSYDLSCYHIVDEYSFSPTELPLTDREIQLIKRVDQVFIHSPALLERKGHFNPHTQFVPNGVNYRAFATQQEEPADLRKIPHPRIGYIGVIKGQLDIGLLLGLATRHVEWSFVFVGPKNKLGMDAILVDELSKLPNVHFLGHKPIEIACAYPQHLDVCLLPYKANDYTKYIYPLKLHEYLAGGRPIVGTPIRSLLDFSHVVKLASTQEEWSRALEESLTPDAVSIDQIEKRRSIAKQVDWEALVHTIAGSLCNRIGPFYKERFAALGSETCQASVSER
jgi:glycosyltransferase involved in cell wall biosynthesis